MEKRTENHIAWLKEQGYEIRFPGGTSRDGEHACFGVFVRASLVSGRKLYETMVIPYLPSMRTTDDGASEKEFTEESHQTLEREISEETGVLINKGTYELLGTRLVDNYREDKKGEKHTKYAYIIFDYDASNIRTKPSPYQQMIGVPFWVPLNMSLSKIIAPTHQWIISKSLRAMHNAPLSEKAKKRSYEPGKRNRYLSVSALL